MSRARGYTKETISQISATKRDFPAFDVGDSIAVSFRIVEKDTSDKKGKETKERLQVFTGDVIAIRGSGAQATFTVRKIGAHGVAVEKIVPFHSPLVATIELLKKGDVRRAKLYYVRGLVGKASRLKEKVMTAEQLRELASKGVDVEALQQEGVVVEENNEPKLEE